RHPMRTMAAMRYALGLKESSWKQRGRVLCMMTHAADLADHAAKLGLEHIHCHSCADAAHVLAMCRILGGPSYSLTLHGDLPVYGTDHAAKMAGATLVSTDGGHLKTQIVEKVGFAPERILATCMGVEMGRFRPEKSP